MKTCRGAAEKDTGGRRGRDHLSHCLIRILDHKKGYYKEPQLCDECRILSEVTNDSSSKTAMGGNGFTACGTFLSPKKISYFVIIQGTSK